MLGKFNDYDLKKICGSDAALYLVFLRYSANYFTLLSVLDILLIFFYINGDPVDDKAKGYFKNSAHAM